MTADAASRGECTRSDSIKRIFDILFSLVGLLLLSPLLLIVSLLIKLETRGSALFIQNRIGKDFKPFNLYKFRTMIDNSEFKGTSITAEGDNRVTKIGKFLRKTKIDELPQLINVLKDDMSLVGPRPEVNKYVELFREDYKEVLKIKPGITDYATIEFRDEEEVLKKYENPEEGYIKEVLPRKIELYKRYMNKMSLSTDMKLIFLTLWRIIS